MAEITTFRAHNSSIDPALYVEVQRKLGRNRDVLIECGAMLKLGEKTISRGDTRISPGGDRRRVFQYEYTDDRTDQVLIGIEFPLSRNALSYIEDQRDHDPQGDLTFAVEVYSRQVRLSISVASELRIGEKEAPSAKGAMYDVGSRFESQLQLVSANRNGEVFEVSSLTSTPRYTVASSDWAQKFCPALGIGTFLSVDLPVVDVTVSGTGDFEQRVQKAVEALEEMQRHMRSGEWNQAVQEARHVAEVLRKQTDTIKSLIERDEINREGAENLTDALWGLFNYTSKFVHSEDREKNVMDRSKASKEDAQLAYTLAASVINLISKKMQRVGLPGRD